MTIKNEAEPLFPAGVSWGSVFGVGLAKTPVPGTPGNDGDYRERLRTGGRGE